jgi:hypothetical protein
VPGVLTLLSLLVACGDDDPVLTAVAPPAERPVEQVVAERRAKESRATPAAIGGLYEKPKGVYIDAPYFGGRDWTATRDEIARQLGAVETEEITPDKARLITLERARVRLIEGRIQSLDVTLPEPLRRSEALAVLGIPPVQDAYRSLAYEFRISNVHGFRRIRLFRVGRDKEEVNRVELTRFLNSER